MSDERTPRLGGNGSDQGGVGISDEWKPGPHDRITASQHLGADEIVLSDVTVYLEDMGDWFHLHIHKPGTDLRIAASIRTNKGGVAVTVTEVEGADGLPVDPDAMERP